MFSLSALPKISLYKRKRIGRGEGSRRGKNAGKGHKGQTKRSGKVPVFFEGGKKSLVRRTPKFKGFSTRANAKTAQITTGILNSQLPDNALLSIQTLKDHKIIKSHIKKVRVIKKGDVTKTFQITEDGSFYLTKGAKDIISK